VTDPTPYAPRPVVIDTDPGIDDLLALELALKSPELDVRGISVCGYDARADRGGSLAVPLADLLANAIGRVPVRA